MKGMELRTERLVLREFRLDDEAAVHHYGSDEEVTRYLTWGPNSQADTTAYLQRVALEKSREPRTSFTLAVTTLDGELVGVVNLIVVDAASTGELGYVLSRESWGHGYATEVAQRLINFGFGELGLRRITATCHLDNHASARVLEKVGMHAEGIMRNHRQIQGEWSDWRLFAISTDHKYDNLTD